MKLARGKKSDLSLSIMINVYAFQFLITFCLNENMSETKNINWLLHYTIFSICLIISWEFLYCMLIKAFTGNPFVFEVKYSTYSYLIDYLFNFCIKMLFLKVIAGYRYAAGVKYIL